jgi:glutamate racemase
MIQRKIGVFDSGIGGLSVALAIKKALPMQEVIFKNDAEHVPYGTKPPAELLGYVTPMFEDLIAQGCELIVVACNTVSTTLIDRLRGHFNVPLIAMEPMVKPACAMTKTNIIAVCATPTTLASERYAALKREFADNITVLEPDCSDWAFMIEENEIDERKIAERIREVLQAGADVIVLGCTHYHWIEEEIVALTHGKAHVLQPEPAVIEELKRVLARL